MAKRRPKNDDSENTLNEELLARSVTHQTYIQRVATGTSNAAFAILAEDLIPEVEARIQSRLKQIAVRQARGLGDRGPWTTKRFKDMLTGVRRIVDAGMELSKTAAFKQLNEFAQLEAAWTAGVIETSAPLAIELTVPSPQLLRGIVRTQPMRGEFLGKWFDQIGLNLKTGVERQLRTNLLAGDSIPQIMRDVRPLLGPKLKKDVEAVVRTASNHVSNASRVMTYQSNEDVVKGWQYVATLDASTCPICGPLDGQTFSIGDGPVPPRHPNCRCTTTPITKSFREMGIDMDEFGPGLRHSMNGLVPSTTTYPQWLRGQSTAVQNQVLGTTKAKAFRAGKIKLSRFSTDNRVLTNKELRRLEPDAFPKRRKKKR
jgi:SPP1 gp7 family putative phage head morphogenesis protein